MSTALMTQDQRVFAGYGVQPQELRWIGRPPSGIRLRAADAYLIPFSLMWGGFAIFWETMAFKGNAPVFFRIWGVPFVLIGVYMILGRFFYDAYRRSQTWYGVTANDALIIRRGFPNSMQRINLAKTNTLGISLKADGSGTITFADTPQRAWMGGGGWSMWSGDISVPAFEGIPDAQHAYDLCTSLQRA
jgi:hypothetical protein